MRMQRENSSCFKEKYLGFLKNIYGSPSFTSSSRQTEIMGFTYSKETISLIMVLHKSFWCSSAFITLCARKFDVFLSYMHYFFPSRISHNANYAI